MQVYWFTLGCLSVLLYFIYIKFLPKVIAICVCIASFIIGMIYPLLQINLSTLQVFTCLVSLLLFLGAIIARSHPGWDAKEEAIDQEPSNRVIPNSELTNGDQINIDFCEVNISVGEETSNYHKESESENKNSENFMQQNLHVSAMTNEETITNLDFLPVTKPITPDSIIASEEDDLDELGIIEAEQAVIDNSTFLSEKDQSNEMISRIVADVVSDNSSQGISDVDPKDVSCEGAISNECTMAQMNLSQEDVLDNIEETQIKPIFFENFNRLEGSSEPFEESSATLSPEELDASDLLIGQETENNKEQTLSTSAESILAEGLRLSKDKQYIPAVKLFNKVLASEPQPEILYLAVSELSSIYQHLGLYQVASDIIVAYMEHSILKYHPGMENLKQKMKFIECLTQLLNKYHYAHIPYDQVPEAVRREAFYNSLNIITFIS